VEHKSAMKTIQGNLVNIINREIFPASLSYEGGKIVDVKRLYNVRFDDYILPGLIDAHVHIESSMLTPARFAEAVIPHGTVATVSDPHEIANVLGLEGIRFMIEDAKRAPLKIFFGAPSCVPATPFESSGASIGPDEIKELLSQKDIKYLSEMMNYPGVINGDPDVLKKLEYAKFYKKPVDGHSPGLKGKDLDKYITAGVKTDHECFTIEEAEEKIKKGMLIQIRQGSAARNFESLYPLVDKYPDQVMFCSDDTHPDQLLRHHMEFFIREGLRLGLNLFNLLRAASLNITNFYNLNVGHLRIGDTADFIIVDNLKKFNVTDTFINGENVFSSQGVYSSGPGNYFPNNFNADPIEIEDIQVLDQNKEVNIIQALDGELITRKIKAKPRVEKGMLISDIQNDLLKIVVLNRYEKQKPAVGFIHGFGIKKGGMISTVAHDSHNIVCVGTSDYIILKLIDWVIETKGGIAFWDGESKIVSIPLPVAGILSDRYYKEIARDYLDLENAVKEAGSKLSAPFMTLSFMSLLVIPEIKLGDKGLFDVSKFDFIDLFE